MFGFINIVDKSPRDVKALRFRMLTLHQSRSQFAVYRVVMMMAVYLRKKETNNSRIFG